LAEAVTRCHAFLVELLEADHLSGAAFKQPGVQPAPTVQRSVATQR
jgi:hypothetical protein